MKTICVLNNKGGVGKTTTSINLVCGLGNQGNKTLLIDFDPQANSTDYFIEEETEYIYIDEMIQGTETQVYPTKNENVFFIPSRLDLALTERNILLDTKAQHNRLLKVIKGLKETFDYIIIDCPPILNLLIVNALNASDEVIIPIKVDKAAEKGFEVTKQSIQDIADSYDLDLDYKILFTMVNRNNTDKYRMQSIRDKYGDKIIDTIIRSQPKPVTDAGYNQTAVVLGKSNVGDDYKRLIQELLTEWKEV